MLEYAAPIKALVDLMKVSLNAKDYVWNDKKTFLTHIEKINSLFVQISTDYINVFVAIKRKIRELSGKDTIETDDTDNLQDDVYINFQKMRSVRHELRGMIRTMINNRHFKSFHNYLSLVDDAISRFEGERSLSLTRLIQNRLMKDIDEFGRNKGVEDRLIKQIDDFISHVDLRVPAIAETYAALCVRFS